MEMSRKLIRLIRKALTSAASAAVEEAFLKARR